MGRNKNISGIVFSTDPDFKPQLENEEHAETLEPAAQKLQVLLDKKQRAGKSVTLIRNFTGKESDLENLGKQLKTFCGTGGSVKDGEIIVQGDNRDKIVDWLQKNGYRLAKKL